MPEKKKSILKNSKPTDRRMTKPQVTRISNHEPAQKAQAPASISNGQKQLAAFEAAIKLFHARKFKEAREQFDHAAAGPECDVAQRSRLHIAMCDRRLHQSPADVTLGSAEEHYNYGVALINSRKIAEARTHLEKALQIAPGSDHIHYALALAQGLSGDIANAQENLRLAIELEPRNRMIARQDADFAPIVNQSAIHALLYPEKKSW